MESPELMKLTVIHSFEFISNSLCRAIALLLKNSKPFFCFHNFANFQRVSADGTSMAKLPAIKHRIRALNVKRRALKDVRAIALTDSGCSEHS